MAKAAWSAFLPDKNFGSRPEFYWQPWWPSSSQKIDSAKIHTCTGQLDVHALLRLDAPKGLTHRLSLKNIKGIEGIQSQSSSCQTFRQKWPCQEFISIWAPMASPLGGLLWRWGSFWFVQANPSTLKQKQVYSTFPVAQRCRAKNCREFPSIVHTRERFWLQRFHLSSCHSQLYVPGRWLHKLQRNRGKVNLWRKVSRWELHPETHRTGHFEHGQCWTRHERLSVLCLHRQNVMARRKARRLRNRRRRHGRC